MARKPEILHRVIHGDIEPADGVAALIDRGPAHEIETLVLSGLQSFLQCGKDVADELAPPEESPAALRACWQRPENYASSGLRCLRSLSTNW